MLISALWEGAPADLQHEVQRHAGPILNSDRGVEGQHLIS